MPSLFRFLSFVAIVAGTIYGIMFALSLYEPPPREITVTVPTDKFAKQK